MKYLLCCICYRAWISPVAASCCGQQPLDCNPWSYDARVWFRARTSGKAPAINSTLRTSNHAKWRSIARASRAKGREIGRVA